MQKSSSLDLTVQELEQLWHGVQLLHEGAFFAAHECFEDVFRQSKDSVRTLFRGLTQLSASYHQLRLGRGRAARATLNKALAHLKLVIDLSDSFQVRVYALFDGLGATQSAPRFLEVQPMNVSNWPVPDTLPRCASTATL